MNKVFLLCLTALTFTQVMLAERALSYPEEKPLINFAVPEAWVAQMKDDRLFVLPAEDDDGVIVEVTTLEAALGDTEGAVAEAKATVTEDYKKLAFEDGGESEAAGLKIHGISAEGQDEFGPAFINLFLLQHPKAKSHLLLSIISSEDGFREHQKAILGIVGSISAARSGAAMAAKTDAGEAAFVFDERDFFLRASQDGLREFLPEGETFEKWQTLMAEREFAGVHDPRAFAGKMVENAKKNGENGDGRLIANVEAGIYFADFIVYEPKDADPYFAEWNLMRVTKTEAGIKYVQYARRFYAPDASTGKAVIAEREKILPLLAEFEMPNDPAATDEEPRATSKSQP